MTDKTEPRTAATVVLIRDGQGGLETLLLQRNKAVKFAGGMWVFPGGSLDPEDWEQAAGNESAAARVGAAREAAEESNIDIDPEIMVQISHWTTPVAEPKRFYTWFFLAEVPAEHAVAIDDSEIKDHIWITIAEAVHRHEAGELGLFPPTIMTLRRLLGYMSAEDAMIGVAAQDPVRVFPVFTKTDDGIAVMFEGDAGYRSGDAATAGARHRMVMVDRAWHYLHQGVADSVPRLDGVA
ncbi:MAG: NUDIX hydrolase [Gammaproteobacteria bacterium]|nr:NUDIX hydrolase [Gammaproteobacteria bacterium]